MIKKTLIIIFLNKKSNLFYYILLLILAFATLPSQIIAQNNKDLSLTPFKLKKKPPRLRKDNDDFRIDSEKKRYNKKEKIPEQENDKQFSNVMVGILGLYDIFNSKFGIEVRAYLDTNRLFIPVEWQYLFGNYIRIKTWPQIYFSNRETEESTSGFVSIYSDSIVKDDQADSSNAEIGLGGGFSGGGFNLSVWLTTNFYQGTPTIKDLFNFRARAMFQPNKKIYGAFGLKIGTAIAQGSLYSTSATTFELDLDFGFTVWKGLTVFAGIEARTDNLGGMLDSGASITGIQDVIRLTSKLGVGYKF